MKTLVKRQNILKAVISIVVALAFIMPGAAMYVSKGNEINNTLADFPETEYREELTFLKLKSNFLLAENSIKKKKLQRINDTIDAYYTFVDAFKESKYSKEAESIFTKVSEMRNKIKIKNS